MKNSLLEKALRHKFRVLSIIPARGGSKGLPHKNILDLGGKPLLAWSIDASLESEFITHTVVSSDDEKILDIAREYGADIIKRPSELSADTSTSESVVKHAIQFFEDKDIFFDYIILLQPTSPLRNSDDIDESFKILFNSESEGIISVNKIDNKILKAFTVNSEGFLEGITNNKFPFTRRQDLPDVFMPNGALYIMKTEKFKAEEQLLTSKTLMYEMDSIRSIDIDTLDDLEKAQEVLL